MMSTRHFLRALLCASVCYLAVAAQTVEQSPSKVTDQQSVAQDDSIYRQLVERVKNGDLTVNFVQLRDSYADWHCNEKVKTDAPEREAMVAAFEGKKYAKAVGLAESVLDYEFVHIGLHRAAANAYRELGNQPKAEFHETVADKLLNALLTSGDGKTAATAYRVLTVREEYSIMNELGYEVHSQALSSKDGKPYDLLTGKDKKTDKEVLVYFDISSFFGGCERVRKMRHD